MLQGETSIFIKKNLSSVNHAMHAKQSYFFLQNAQFCFQSFLYRYIYYIFLHTLETRYSAVHFNAGFVIRWVLCVAGFFSSPEQSSGWAIVTTFCPSSVRWFIEIMMISIKNMAARERGLFPYMIYMYIENLKKLFLSETIMQYWIIFDSNWP